MTGTSSTTLDFGVLFGTSGHHLAGWRLGADLGGGSAGAELDVTEAIRWAQRYEEAGLTALFVADVVSVWGEHLDSLSRTTRASYFEPFTLLSALAAVTERIGLVATATTSYNEPFTLARKFASLDHISRGRAGWNVVTSVVPLEAGNFGRDAHYGHAERYARAAEVVDAVTGLWDTVADDAFPRDKESGIYLDLAGRRALDYRGDHVATAGPLNISRPPQGHPVIFQAGASETGRAFAARVGEVIFAAPRTLAEAHRYRAGLDDALRAAGRNPADVRVWPALSPVIGSTQEEAARLRDTLDELLHEDVLRRVIQDNVGDVDFSDFDLDAPLPELPESNRSRSRADSIIALAREEGLTLRQLALRWAGAGVVGTPADIADHIQEWFEAGVADGFNLAFPFLPGGADAFLDHVLPELEQRGIWRPHYGDTLRETLSLARPDLTIADFAGATA
ncbi:LLM class flavin-dependent oxidoreductase [Microbacterium sp. SORGH_AS_0862]|uniref:LLM class flavin-dependent oxidoreductase n=1 Tax=Microbacterium sp. SORGH_AS_0862 TaxID=3041789 RepID=UPI002792ADB8|nr:LLM class flavin-dependent oxidoreductase [Microbacterium sp. SORGH_AS_0862]MDQ1205719.1 FMN-dependent oxidoreductase (nitrilotriacetate monooxygenase family) [Microbacterium sp. SORGH_AS_0862]